MIKNGISTHSGAWDKLIRIGVDESQPPIFSDKLQNRNRLSALCALFSLFYVVFFIQRGLYLPLAAISTGILIFTLSILLNYYRKYFLSSLLVLINTNYCVLFFSIYLSFDSGIHLYLFTSPLIVLSLFEPGKKKFLFWAMLSYILNFFIILAAEKFFRTGPGPINPSELHELYTINFIFALLILISLSLYFLFNNENVNSLLQSTNDGLKQENLIRKRTEEQLRNALSERELLLSEVHHRVKNNLAIVSALISMQIESLEDENSKKIFAQTRDRIYTMSLIHNQLYQHKFFARIEFSEYIHNLCQHLLESYKTNISVQIIEKTEKIYFDIQTAIPCALILNELLTNSFKHAFRAQDSGIIEIHLKKNGDKICLYVRDSGSGMDPSILNGTSAGMNIVVSLVDQIDGTLHYSNHLGSEFAINLKTNTF